MNISFKTRIGAAICFVAMLGALSCVDEISLNVDTEQRTVVIDGFVGDLRDNYVLRVSQSSVIGIGNDNILDPVPGARVMLVEAGGASYPYAESSEEPGVYGLTDFMLEEDKEYYVDIVLSDGRHYQSIPAEVPARSEIDNISYEVSEEIFRNNVGELVTEDRIKAKIATDISNSESPPFLRWRVRGEYQLLEGYPGALSPRQCYIKVNLDQNDIRVVDGSSINGDVLFEQVISDVKYDFRFGEQFCYHISQYSITESEFEYWNNIKQVIDIDGSLFDPPPGTVVGNIVNVDNPDDEAVGFFSIASIASSREFVNATELDVFVRGKCQGFQRTTPFGCRDCLAINNSTLERPPYWEF